MLARTHANGRDDSHKARTDAANGMRFVREGRADGGKELNRNAKNNA